MTIKREPDLINEDVVFKQFSFSAHGFLTIVGIDLKGIINQINSPLKDYSLNEIIGQPLVTFYDDEYTTAISNIIKKVVKEKVQLSCETVVSKDEERRCFVNHFEPVIANNKVISIQVIIRDITDSKQAIEALKKSKDEEINSKANLKTVFENTRIGYVLLDKELNVVSFNKPARVMTDELFHKKATLDSNLRDYFPEALRNTLSKNWEQALAGHHVEYEKEYIHDDGSSHWYEIQYLPVKDEHNEVMNLIMKFQDITKRKIKEQEIFDMHEQRFKFAVEGSNDGVWDWNIITNEVFFSERWKSMIGYQEYEIKNEFKEWELRLHPEDRDWVLEEVDRALKNKDYSYAVEHRLKCKDDTYKWILARGKVLVWKGDKPLRMAGTHTDISQRKELEERVVHNEKMLSSILDTLPVILFAKDIKNEYRFSHWNKRAEEIFGLKAADCIGKNDYDFFSKEDADFFRQKDIEAANTTGVLDIPEETVQTPEGPVLVHTLKTVIRDEMGNPRYLLGVSEDIGELKKINNTLKVSEEKYRSLVENSPISIVTIDRNEVIQFINFSITGRAVSELIGHSIYDFVLPEYKQMVSEAHRNVFNTRKSASYEMEYKNADGKVKWFQTHVGPMMIGDEVIGLTIFTRDITERIESEERIKKSLKEKEILLQEVHHRVKNNLQIISSILNLQTKTIQDHKILEIIKETRHRIMSMSFIHDLLYQTKDFTNIDFSKYIKNITSNIMNTYTVNRNIELKLETELILLHLDTAIPCGLIVNELITNAFKYAFPSGKKGTIEVSLKKHQHKVLLSIADNGVGIKKNVDYKTTESLGFQLINSLVEQIGGQLLYENVKGTRFTVSFDV